jgi:uncharacterized Ntn-hydrolase superfamily protein
VLGPYGPPYSRFGRLSKVSDVTYSIVAMDMEEKELGIAVQSCAFNTGAACVWALPGVAAVATQSFTERGYGPRGLALMRDGKAPREALDELLAEDELRDVRQVAFVDREGRTAAHTGDACISHCGDLQGHGLSVQGNMLRSDHVWPAMAEAFRATTGSLAERLLAALDAAEAAGGDFRGRQAAGLVVVTSEEAPSHERVFDLRVDDHPEPLVELRRLHRMAAGYRRRNRIEAGADPEEEAAAARAAGLPERDVTAAVVFAHARNGDMERAAALIAEIVAAEPLWLPAFERYERLGLLPAGVVASDGD